MRTAFPGLDLEEEEEKEETEEDYELVFLWDSNKVLYDIFRLIANFLGENYEIDSSLLIELIKEEGLKFKSTLQDISYIHSGYSNILLTARQEKYDNENPST